MNDTKRINKLRANITELERVLANGSQGYQAAWGESDRAVLAHLKSTLARVEAL